MANPDHVALLQHGPAFVNQQREVWPDLVLDLSGAQLNGGNFAGANFTGAKLQGVNFYTANLSGANLSASRLHGALLQHANLSDADLSGADCTSAHFGEANLTGVRVSNETTFKSATLTNAQFTIEMLRRSNVAGAQLQEADLTDADLSDCNLSGANFNGARLNGARFTNSKLIEAHFTRAQLRDSDFRGADISRSHFDSANLSGATLAGAKCFRVHFENAILEGTAINGADFNEAMLNGASLEHIKGASLARNLLTTDIGSGVRYFETAVRHWPERLLDWETIRIFGRLPIFGASYTGVILIPAYVYFLQIYNDKVEAARAWITHAVGTSTGLSATAANAVLDHMRSEPVPDSFFWLFLSTFCLAVAATIYAFACPSRIKEFSRDQWCDELGRSLVHYWSAAWKGRTVRLACAALYAVGAAGAALALAPKLWRTAVILFRSEFTL